MRSKSTIIPATWCNTDFVLVTLSYGRPFAQVAFWRFWQPFLLLIVLFNRRSTPLLITYTEANFYAGYPAWRKQLDLWQIISIAHKIVCFHWWQNFIWPDKVVFLTAYTIHASTAINCMKKSTPAAENMPAAIFRTTGTIAYMLFVRLPDQ